MPIKRGGISEKGNLNNLFELNEIKHIVRQKRIKLAQRTVSRSSLMK